MFLSCAGNGYVGQESGYMAMDTDVLIIGCGIAGAATALRLAEDRERNIMIITRTPTPEESNTRYAQGDRAVGAL